MNEDAQNRAVGETVELGSRVADTGPRPAACVIWLHGLGADGGDFASLPDELALPADTPTRFIFPDAPMRAITINGGAVMRGWYDIYDDISPDAPQDEEGMMASAHIVNELVEQELARGVAPARVLLGGFSQGGAVALYAGLTSRRAIGGVIALSTYLPLHSRFAQSPPQNTPPVFMAHGEYDPTIPLAYARLSHQRLKALGVAVEWRIYAIPHALCAEEVAAIREWLLARLS